MYFVDFSQDDRTTIILVIVSVLIAGVAILLLLINQWQRLAYVCIAVVALLSLAVRLRRRESHKKR